MTKATNFRFGLGFIGESSSRSTAVFVTRRSTGNDSNLSDNGHWKAPPPTAVKAEFPPKKGGIMPLITQLTSALFRAPSASTALPAQTKPNPIGNPDFAHGADDRHIPSLH